MLIDLLKEAFKRRKPAPEAPANLSFAATEYQFYKSFKLNPSSGSGQKQQVFIHIPKTAGTTLDRICTALCVHKIYDYWRVKGGVSADFLAWNNAEALTQLKELSQRPNFSSPRFISGHFPFCPELFDVNKVDFITLLRNPHSQLTSFYNFLIQRNVIDKADSLEKTIKSGRLMDNMQVRQLAGEAYIKGPCDAGTLQKARDNLDQYFSLVGTADNFRDFVTLWLSMNDWPNVVFPSFQVTGVKTLQSPTPELNDLITDFNQYDNELYHFARQKFASDFKRHIPDVSALEEQDEVLYLPEEGITTNASKLISAKVFNQQYLPRLKIS